MDYYVEIRTVKHFNDEKFHGHSSWIQTSNFRDVVYMKGYFDMKESLATSEYLSIEIKEDNRILYTYDNQTKEHNGDWEAIKKRRTT